MSVLYTSPTAHSVSNTVSELTLFSTVPALSADTLVVGTTIRTTIRGVLGTTGLFPPAMRVRAKIGATVICESFAVTAPLANAAAHYFTIEVLMTMRSLGGGGTAIGEGHMLCTEDASVIPKLFELATTTPQAVDTTIDNALDVTMQWGTASIFNSITAHHQIVEYLGAT